MMRRGSVIVSSALALGILSIVPMDAAARGLHTSAQAQVGAGTEVEPRVPLPVARPGWIGNLGAKSDADPQRFAQNSSESGQSTGTAPVPEGKGLKSGSTEALSVQLEGAKVMSAEGDVVGEVERVIDEPGQVRHAVVSVGGFLGIGTSKVLIPADSLVPSSSGVVRTELTEAQLKNLPEFDG